MKNHYIITTQYLENYGAHSGSGKFSDGQAHWKFKGGEQYLISTKSQQYADAVAFLTAYLHERNNSVHSKEIVVSWDHEPLPYPSRVNEEGYIAIDIEEYFKQTKKGNK